MAKTPSISSILSGFGSTARLNANFSAILASFGNTLSLDGSAPNSMAAPLDMNSHNVVNVSEPVNPTDAATKNYVDTHGGSGGSGTGDMLKADNLAGLANTATARINLGLGAVAQKATLASTDLTDFTEATQDVVGGLLVAGSNVTLSYNDPANTLTINASLAGGTVSSTAGSSVDGEMVLFSGTSGTAIKNSSCVPSANGLVILGHTYSQIRTDLGLGTSATVNTGTSGATIPLLNASNTWASTQTFSVAPAFGDGPNTRINLGLGTSATVNTGTSGGTIPLLNGTNTWASAQTFTVAPVFTATAGTRTALGLGSVALLNDLSTSLAAGTGVTMSTTSGVTTINSTGSGSTGKTVNYMIVGGGGGGGMSDASRGAGGGGGGGLVIGTTQVSANTYTITVGTGGAGATSRTAAGINGGASSFNGVMAAGGGGGGSASNGTSANSGGDGGSGGGSTSDQISGGGNVGKFQLLAGHTGGSGSSTSGTSGSYIAGGGGGGGAAGRGVDSASTTTGGAGGPAFFLDYFIYPTGSSNIQYCCGGGGGSGSSSSGAAGTGSVGGAGGTSGSSAVANTGSGGGAGTTGSGGAGSDGFVVVWFPTGAVTASGGTSNTKAGIEYHTFTSSSTLVVS